MRDVFETDPGDVEEIILQKVDSGGITDVEVISTRAHLIIEAKRGWVLPHRAAAWSVRPKAHCDCPAPQAPPCPYRVLQRVRRPSSARRVNGQKVEHRSWSEVIAHAQRATTELGRIRNDTLLGSLSATSKESRRCRIPLQISRTAYHLVRATPKAGQWPRERCWIAGSTSTLSGRGGQSTPRTSWRSAGMDGFRSFATSRALRSRRDSTRSFVRSRQVGIPKVPFLVYRLGPPIPFTPLPTGVDSTGKRINYRDSRFRVAVDLILTSDSIEEAVAKTKARLSEVE